MKASELSNNIINELKSVKASKVSLAEALHKIDLVLALTDRFDRVEAI
jgi:hypothetical protein